MPILNLSIRLPKFEAVPVYLQPAYGIAAKNNYAKALLADWTIGSVLQYASGNLVAVPSSNKALGTYLPGQSSRMFRVPG